MDNLVEQEAGRFIRNSGVNVQCSFTVDYEGEVLFVLRATPWRNSSSPNRMILVAGHTILDALLLLAEALFTPVWLPLDWKALPGAAGVWQALDPGPVDLMERVRKLREEQAKRRGETTSPTEDPSF